MYNFIVSKPMRTKTLILFQIMVRIWYDYNYGTRKLHIAFEFIKRTKGKPLKRYYSKREDYISLAAWLEDIEEICLKDECSHFDRYRIMRWLKSQFKRKSL